VYGKRPKALVLNPGGMEKQMETIERALKQGRTVLSEYEAKQVLKAYGIPVVREIMARDVAALRDAAGRIGYPIVLKGCSPNVAHKTERGLIRVDIRNEEEMASAYEEIISRMPAGEKDVLVQEMVEGSRELVAGLMRDSQFGPCVMFGLGGIFTEILRDIAFRPAPLTIRDAMDLMDDIRGKRILESVRGMEAVDRRALAELLIHVGQIGVDIDQVREIDVNPLKVRNGQPIAVDALIVLKRDSSVTHG